MSNKNPYESFGKLLVELRRKAGISQQTDLAKLMKTTQQAVSRWELGQSRPRYKQMALLTVVLKATELSTTLLSAAGYATKTVVTSFDQPFPIDALTPESFERFCSHFLQMLYPHAKVNRVGGPGHKQEGIDIEAAFDDGRIHTFQCKRVDQFGPADLREAISKHTRKADEKFILMSRVASPQTRQEAKKHPHWGIWDKEDISQRIRTKLQKDDQIRLVDIFFPGQREALLGAREAGPWQSVEKFFAPFIEGTGIFNHNWDLVGRTDEIRSLITGLTDGKTKAVFLLGAGGAGKSRILLKALEDFEEAHKDVAVYILAPGGEITDKTLENMGNKKKILVVDDAHDRNDLQLLFQYAATPDNNATLLLSLRPYGLPYIKTQAGNFTLAGKDITEISISLMTLEQATALAVQGLKKFNGPLEMAESIANYTRDCPLAVVIGAQVVAKEKKIFELAKSAEEFRQILLSKFKDIIAGELGTKNNAESIKKILRVVALLQPFHLDDKDVSEVCALVEGIGATETHQIIRQLIDAGVLFRRGGKYQLSPDMLADYIIEESCIGPEDRSTGYAERIFDVVSPDYIEHLLLNLGKLDWSRKNGNPDDSKLLDGVWKKLEPRQEYSDPYIKAVTAVAYYQPRRALEFAEKQIRKNEYLRDLPTLIKYAAYNHAFIKQGCECLWELGKKDKRNLNQHPGHAIRVLSELCQVEPNKPVDYNETVVDFALGLLPQLDAWDYAYTPLDILKGIMRTEGHTNRSDGRAISFTKYLVNYTAVHNVREKTINAVIGLLSSANINIALLAAKLLQESLRYPMDGTLETREEWTGEFCQTLKKIEAFVQSAPLDPLVMIELIRTVSWHAHHAGEATGAIAKRIIGLSPATLEFRTLSTLVDGYGQFLENVDFTERERVWKQHVSTLTNNLLLEYPDAKSLHNFLAAKLLHIRQYIGASDSPFVLIQSLIRTSLELARCIVDAAIENPETSTTFASGVALSELLNKEHSEGLKKAKCFLESGSRELQVRLANAYMLFNFSADTTDDVEILRVLLKTGDLWIVKNAALAVRNIANENPKLAISLLRDTNIGTDKQLADDILVLFVHAGIPFELLTDDDVKVMLGKLMPLPEIDGYWTDAFLAKLSEHHPLMTLDFFINRVEHLVKTQEPEYRPCNYGPYSHTPLRFRHSSTFGLVLRKVVTWMQARKSKENESQQETELQKYYFREFAAHLFNTLFHPIDSDVIGALQDWVEVATAEDMTIICQIFSKVPRDFVFQNKDFVVRFMDKAKQFGKEAVTRAEGSFYSSAVSGVRMGTPGEPFQVDLDMKKAAENILVDLPRFSSAYNIYNDIKRHAEQDIQRSLKEREMFEE